MEYKKIIPAADILRAECVLAQNGKAESITSVHKRTGADIVLNTALFDMRSGAILSRVVAGGKRYGKAETYGIGFGPAPVWTYDNGAACPHYVGAYTYAALDGKARDGLKDSGKRGRSALGLTAAGDLVIYVVTDNDSRKCSTLTLCQRMLDLGCVNAINLDGGGSSQAITPEGAYNSGRAVPAYLCIWLRETDKEGDKMKVCIDPGHGVETPGKCAPDKSYYEHEFALDVGQRLRAALTRCGAQVVMTRSNEQDVTLNKRCQISNMAKSNYFVSIHSNAAGNYGWYSAEGMSTHIIAKGGKAEVLAKEILTQAVATVGCKSRGVEVSNYQVVRETDAPAVLVECGFHTSKAEVEKLKRPEYRQGVAEAVCKALCKVGGLAYVAATPEVDNTPSSAEAAKAVAWMTDNRHLRGDDKGNLRLHSAPTMEQLCVILYRIYGEV